MLRDKELAHVKFTIEELQNDSKLKDVEIRSLKMMNAELKEEIKAMKEADQRIDNGLCDCLKQIEETGKTLTKEIKLLKTNDKGLNESRNKIDVMEK